MAHLSLAMYKAEKLSVDFFFVPVGKGKGNLVRIKINVAKSSRGKFGINLARGKISLRRSFKH